MYPASVCVFIFEFEHTGKRRTNVQFLLFFSSFSVSPFSRNRTFPIYLCFHKSCSCFQMTRNLYVIDADGRRAMDPRTRELLDKDSKEIQTILVMGGITFFVTIVMFLSKMDVSFMEIKYVNYWLIVPEKICCIWNCKNMSKSDLAKCDKAKCSI